MIAFLQVQNKNTLCQGNRPPSSDVEPSSWGNPGKENRENVPFYKMEKGILLWKYVMEQENSSKRSNRQKIKESKVQNRENMLTTRKGARSF